MTPLAFLKRAEAIVAQTPNEPAVREAMRVDLMQRCLYELGYYAGLRLFDAAAEAHARKLEDEAYPRAARDVPVGESWVFPDHRPLSEVDAPKKDRRRG